MSATVITATRGFGLYAMAQTSVGTHVDPTQASDKALPVVSSADIVQVETTEDGTIENESAPFGGVNAGKRGGIYPMIKFSTRCFVAASGNNISGFPEFFRLFQACALLVDDSTSNLVMTPAFGYNAHADASTTAAPRVASFTKIERNGNVTRAKDCVGRIVKISGEGSGAVAIEWEFFGRAQTTAADTVLGIDDTSFDASDIAFRAGVDYYECRGITLSISGVSPLGDFNVASFEFDPGMTVAMQADQQDPEGIGVPYCSVQGKPSLKVVVTQAPEDVNGFWAAFQADTAVTATLTLAQGSQRFAIALAAGRLLRPVNSDADGKMMTELTIVPSSVNAGAFSLTHSTAV